MSAMVISWEGASVRGTNVLNSCCPVSHGARAVHAGPFIHEHLSLNSECSLLVTLPAAL